MATDTKKAQADTNDPGVSGQEPLVLTPVYYRLKKGKRGRRKAKYTRGTKGWQRLGLGVSGALYRAGRSVSDGFDTFYRRSRKSRRKKRDGMIRYSLRNASRGAYDAAKQFGRVPEEIANRISTGNVRSVFRLFSPFG